MARYNHYIESITISLITRNISITLSTGEKYTIDSGELGDEIFRWFMID